MSGGKLDLAEDFAPDVAQRERENHFARGQQLVTWWILA
jgi:hypothetical protein